MCIVKRGTSLLGSRLIYFYKRTTICECIFHVFNYLNALYCIMISQESLCFYDSILLNSSVNVETKHCSSQLDTSYHEATSLKDLFSTPASFTNLFLFSSSADTRAGTTSLVGFLRSSAISVCSLDHRFYVT